MPAKQTESPRPEGGSMTSPALEGMASGEVFVRSKQGLEHKHCGSLHASDARTPCKWRAMYNPPPGRREHLSCPAA